MQKFKFNKNSLPISIRSRLTPTDLQQLPELFLLEGELLEGGTVEKCCETCLYRAHTSCALCECHKVEKRCSNPDCIGCHNKKEEGYKWVEIKIEAKGKDFNRETLKECPSDHVMKDGKCAVTDGFIKCVCKCSFCSAGEEVKLPEMLDINEKITPDPIVYAYKNRTKIVEILTYLASKENK